jgi:hypothetical protein
MLYLSGDPPKYEEIVVVGMKYRYILKQRPFWMD